MNVRIGRHLAPFFAPLRLCGRYFSTPRAANDYATHVPILIGLARLREIRRVLEFGCGYYSTLTFLNRTAFPHLERLVSIENDAAWAATVHEAATEDARWTLKLVNGEIADCIRNIDLEVFDLILIDDSKSSAQRAATIRAVAARHPQTPWIAIHDFEVEEYRQAAAGFVQRHRFKAFNPETGVVSNTLANIRILDRVLKEESRVLEPDDVAAWTTAFLSILKIV
jgi:SAM-dependent methyltransferase